MLRSYAARRGETLETMHLQHYPHFAERHCVDDDTIAERDLGSVHLQNCSVFRNLAPLLRRLVRRKRPRGLEAPAIAIAFGPLSRRALRAVVRVLCRHFAHAGRLMLSSRVTLRWDLELAGLLGMLRRHCLHVHAVTLTCTNTTPSTPITHPATRALARIYPLTSLTLLFDLLTTPAFLLPLATQLNRQSHALQKVRVELRHLLRLTPSLEEVAAAFFTTLRRLRLTLIDARIINADLANASATLSQSCGVLSTARLFPALQALTLHVVTDSEITELVHHITTESRLQALAALRIHVQNPQAACLVYLAAALQRLRLRTLDVNTGALLVAFDALETLSICAPSPSAASTWPWAQICTLTPALRSLTLELTNASQALVDCATAMIACLEHLKSLTLRWTYTAHNTPTRCFSERYFPRVRRLCLGFTSKTSNHSRLPYDRITQEVAASFPHLRALTLEFTHTGAWHEAHLLQAGNVLANSSFATGLEQLALHISRCEFIPVEALELLVSPLAKKLTALRRFELAICALTSFGFLEHRAKASEFLARAFRHLPYFQCTLQ